MRVLITGGAGFIGSHIVDALVKKEYNVTVLDNLVSTGNKLPEYFNKKASFINGDIRNKTLLDKIIPNFDVIFHKASSVGIAQSNYEIKRFVDNNSLGTANLLQAIIDSKKRPKLIFSASNTTYGEGIYLCEEHGKFHPKIRTKKQIDDSGFEFTCPVCKKYVKPNPTPEKTELHCNSVYALTKKNQEELILLLGKLYDFPVVNLKYFNVFGPRQSLSNPYTGVSAIFSGRIKNNQPVIIYEDGLQSRDFVYIDDVVNANMLAMESSAADYQVFNVGSGIPITIKEVAEKIYQIYDKKFNIKINNEFRKGDIRHCIADTTKIKKFLGWKPKVSFKQGIKNLFEWSKDQESETDIEKADLELREKGLL